MGAEVKAYVLLHVFVNGGDYAQADIVACYREEASAKAEARRRWDLVEERERVQQEIRQHEEQWRLQTGHDAAVEETLRVRAEIQKQHGEWSLANDLRRFPEFVQAENTHAALTARMWGESSRYLKERYPHLADVQLHKDQSFVVEEIDTEDLK